MIKRHKAIVGSTLSLFGWFLASFCAFALMSVVLQW